MADVTPKRVLEKRIKQRKLPSIEVPQTGQDEVDRALQGVAEHLRMYEGSSNAPKERFVSLEELEAAGIVDLSLHRGFASISGVFGKAVQRVSSSNTSTVPTDTTGSGGSGGSSGPRLWDDLDDVSTPWKTTGSMPYYDGETWATTAGDLLWVPESDYLQLGIAHSINWLDIDSNSVELLVFDAVTAPEVEVDHSSAQINSAVSVTDDTSYNTIHTLMASGVLTTGDDYLLVAKSFVGVSSGLGHASDVVANTRMVYGATTIFDIKTYKRGYTGSGSPSRAAEMSKTKIITATASDTLILEGQTEASPNNLIQAEYSQYWAVNLTDFGAANYTTPETVISAVSFVPLGADNTWNSIGTSYTVGDGTSDYVLFVNFHSIVTDTRAGSGVGWVASVRVSGGPWTDSELFEVGGANQRNNDEYVQTGILMLKAPANNTALTFEGRWHSVSSDDPATDGTVTVTMDIIAMKMNGWAQHDMQISADLSDAGTGTNEVLTSSTTSTAATSDWGFLGGLSSYFPGSGWDAQSEILADNAGGGDTNAAGEVDIANDGTLTDRTLQAIIPKGTETNVALSASLDFGLFVTAPAVTVGDALDAGGIVAFSYRAAASLDIFTAGDPSFKTLIHGSEVEIDSTLNVTGATDLDSTLNVDGIADFNANVDINSAVLTVTGTQDIIHTATENDEHALEIDVIVGAYSDVKALDINYITGALASESDEAVVLFNIDDTLATGGDVSALTVLVTPGVADRITALTVGATVHPVEQLSGTFGNPASALNKAVDVLAAISSGGGGAISIFVADDDTVTIGSAAKFEEIAWILATGASGGGIQPKYEYSTGVSTWAEFGPIDGTNGLRHTGIMQWLDEDLANWLVGTGTEFLIRITRQRNSLTTTPIVDTIQISADSLFYWDKLGDVQFNDAVLIGNMSVLGHGTNTFEGDFVIQDDGGTDNLTMSHDGTNFNAVFTNTTDVLFTGATDYKFDNSVFITESSSANSNTAGEGQFWVQDNNINSPRFSTDTGVAYPLNVALSETDYEYSSTVTAADPGAGKVRFDSVTIGSITEMYIDDNPDLSGHSYGWVLDNLDTGDLVWIKGEYSAGDYIIATVTSTPTDNVGWWTVPLTLIDTGAIFTDTDHLRISIQWLSSASTVPSASVTVADESTDTTCFPLFVTAATGDLGPKSAAGLTFDSSTDDLNSTLIAGIANANLVDLAAAESITGQWSFDDNVIITTGAVLQIKDTGNTDWGQWNHNGTVLKLTATNTTDYQWINFTGDLWLRDGMGLKISDSTDADYVAMSHDGTDFNVVGTNTANINIDTPLELSTQASSAINAINLLSNTPSIWFLESDSGTDLGGWKVYASSDNFNLYTTDDAGAAVTKTLQFQRGATTAVTRCSMGAPLQLNNNETKYKSAATARTNTTTLSNDTHLSSWVLEPDSFYKFTGYVKVDSGSATPDLKFDFNWDNAPLSSGVSWFCNNSLGIESSDSGTMGTNFVVPSGTGDRFITMTGHVDTHATLDTTIDFRWSQNTLDAVADTTLFAGSWMTFTRLGNS